MPEFIVDFSPIYIRFRDFTIAKDKRDAVHHSIVRYLGDNSRIGLFINRQKELWGEEGWMQKIEDMADEVIETPALKKTPKKAEEPDRQLELFEFQRMINKAHPGTDIAHSWKLYHRMTFINFDGLSELVGEKEATFSAKMDGELCCVYFDGTRVDLVTVRGTIRTGMPPTDEAAKLLAGHKNAAFLGELYSVDESGKPQSYMKAASILKDPKGGHDHLLRLSVFDLHTLDGIEYESLGIDDKLKKINELFKNGKTVHPVPAVHGTMDKAEEMWSQLETNGWEGLVVHFGADLYKVKPIQSYDLVVIGINKSNKFMDQMSAVLCAFMDKEGRFRLSSAIGGGFNDEERIRLQEWGKRNMVMEDEERIWVDPFKEPLIVEIEAVETNEKPRPTYEFKGKIWVRVENMLSGTLRFPQFVKERADKEATHDDVPVEQIVQQESAFFVGATTLVPGKYIKTYAGAIGQIVGISPRNGELAPTDFNVVVQWETPIRNEIDVSEIRPTEIREIWV